MNQKLSVKIFGGFGCILILMLIVATYSWRGLSTMSDGITEYDRKTRNFNRVSDIQELMLMVQLKGKEYYQHHEEKDLQEYQKLHAELLKAIEDGNANIKNAKRREMLAKIKDLSLQYDKQFSQISSDIKNGDTLLGNLRGIGASMQEKLNDITEQAKSSQDVEAIFHANNALQNMLLARLYAQRFTTTASAKDASMMLESNSALAKELEYLTQNSRAKIHELAAEIADDARSYRATFEQMAKYIQSQESIYDSILSKIGSDVTEISRKMHASHTEEQQAFGNNVNKNGQAYSRTAFFVSAIAIVLGLLLAYLLIRSIVKPILQTAKFADELANGDFTHKIHIKQNDEIGQMAQALNTMVDKLGKTIREVVGGSNSLLFASNDLSAVSQNLSDTSKDASSRSSSVAAAAEEMSTGFQSISAAMEQSSTNVSMIASATEEMSATVNEIITSAKKARIITDGAVRQSSETSIKMASLGESAKKISTVTETITEISEQTNLLALNATIEAARAGEAGKGFAVVANEIKELARQTASATVDIKNQIDEMQTTTGDTISQIEKISEVISEINSAINSISIAVEEQSSATKEIASNIAQSSQGILEVNGNVLQSTEVAHEIAREITGLHSAADGISVASSQVNISAQDLAKLAKKLATVVEQFQFEKPKFDIAAVKDAHLQWRTKLEGLLHGQNALLPAEVTNHHQCDFGKWYDNDGKKMCAHLPAFTDVGLHHEKVHKYAQQIVDCHHRGEKEKAITLMENFEDERSLLFSQLDALYLA